MEWKERPGCVRWLVYIVGFFAFAALCGLTGVFKGSDDGTSTTTAPVNDTVTQDSMTAALSENPYSDDDKTTDDQDRLGYVELQGNDSLRAVTIQLNVGTNEQNAIGQWEIALGIHSIFHEHPEWKVAAATFELWTTPTDDYGNKTDPELVYRVTFDANQAARVNWDKWEDLPWDRLWTVERDEMP